MRIVFEFDPEKSALLKAERGVGFEEIIALIQEGKAIDIIDHPNPARYPGQRIYVVDIDGYAWLVPFTLEGRKCRLITAFASRKATKKRKEKST